MMESVCAVTPRQGAFARPVDVNFQGSGCSWSVGCAVGSKSTSGHVCSSAFSRKGNLVVPTEHTLLSVLGAQTSCRLLMPRHHVKPLPRNVGVRACAEGSAVGSGNKLPDKKKPLYSHSLPSIELWLTSLGFYQSKVDRAVWLIERPDWHAQLSLDFTELHIKYCPGLHQREQPSKVLPFKKRFDFDEAGIMCRYLKSGPGNLEKDMERKFSYALSREDLDNAILGGP